MHLLQIIGGQTWPNFLPLLFLSPKKITFLISSDPRGDYEKSIRNICEAAAPNTPFEIEIIKTSTKEPTVQEASSVLTHLSPDIINLTGGTKPMSIAAFNLSQKKNLTSFYLDTRRKPNPFEITHQGKHPISFPNIEDLAEKISVRTALMAQGFPVPNTFQSPRKNEITFSKQASQIRQSTDANLCIAKNISNLRRQLMGSGTRMPKKSALRKALQTPITPEPNSPFHHYLQAAAQQEIIEEITSSPDRPEYLLTRLDPITENANTLRSTATHNFKLLEGVWFELILLDHLQSKSSFSDICWSVEADAENADSIGETDIVAFNKKTLTLHFISCKTSGPHGSALDHIQGLRRRATKEGGKYSKAELWIFAPKSEESKQSLLNHCKEQNVSLRIFTEELLHASSV